MYVLVRAWRQTFVLHIKRISPLPVWHLRLVLRVHPPHWCWASLDWQLQWRTAAGACQNRGPGPHVVPGPRSEGPQKAPAELVGRLRAEPWWVQWWGQEGCSFPALAEWWHGISNLVHLEAKILIVLWLLVLIVTFTFFFDALISAGGSFQPFWGPMWEKHLYHSACYQRRRNVHFIHYEWITTRNSRKKIYEWIAWYKYELNLAFG